MPATTEKALPDHRREALLEAAVAHVPFDGWNARALRAGARDLGLDPGQADLLFPGGGTEMIELHSRIADRAMMAAFETRDLAGLRTREKIALAVRLRLERAGNEREAVRRAIALLALPGNAALGARLLYHTVDAIWYAAGDTATDWNFYTKRALLAGVYGSTVLFWLQDRSPAYEETWAFLDRRIEDVMRVPQVQQRLSRLLDPLRRMRPSRYGRYRGAA